MVVTQSGRTETSEEALARQRRKRWNAVRFIKSLPSYQTWCDHGFDDSLMPDPEDTRMSKREWETAVQLWRFKLGSFHDTWFLWRWGWEAEAWWWGWAADQWACAAAAWRCERGLLQ